jgi:predicted alpha/beta superfamily hydrolase
VEAGPSPAGHTLTGHFDILRRFQSLVLGNTRNIFVYLPPCYAHESTRRYPVLYMQDGQNLFDPALSFIPGNDWQLDETAEFLIARGEIEPLIIVGIEHAGHDRTMEFSPSRDARLKAGGRADDYGRMIVEELKPYIDARYRTRLGPDDTGLGGSSLGGLVALYLGFTWPDVFRRLAVMSPSLWWDRRRLLDLARTLPEHLPLKIWLDTGTSEGGGTLRNAQILKNTLLRHGWRMGKDFRYLEVQGGEHSELDWRSRAGDMLRFLYANEQVDK